MDTIKWKLENTVPLGLLTHPEFEQDYHQAVALCLPHRSGSPPCRARGTMSVQFPCSNSWGCYFVPS